MYLRPLLFVWLLLLFSFCFLVVFVFLFVCRIEPNGRFNSNSTVHGGPGTCKVQCVVVVVVVVVVVSTQKFQRTCSFAAAEGFSFCDLFRPFYRLILSLNIKVMVMLVMLMVVTMRNVVMFIQGRPLV